MKGKKKILVAIILLLLVAVGYTTYAIYRSTTEATGSIRAAKWDVKVKKTGAAGDGTAIDSATLTFDASDITWTNHQGKNNTIAPGDSGTISFDVNALGSEVDVILEADIGASASLPTGVTAEVTSGTNGTQEIPYSTSSMSTTVVITVTWTGTISDTTAKDTTDKAANNTTLSIPVELTARQKLASD